MRPTIVALLAPALLVAPTALRAQTDHAPAGPSAAAAPAATAPSLPNGWAMRLDREGGLAAPTFVAVGTAFHATTGPAAIFYEPARVVRGDYVASATFTQTRAPAHPEAYGLLVGGGQLDAPQQNYLYFVVRGDGQYLLKHRAGTEVHTLQDWTAHPAIHAADAAGRATNALRVRVASDSVHFDVNGTQVLAFAKAGFARTDGNVGLRINHQLDVHVDGFTVTPATR